MNAYEIKAVVKAAATSTGMLRITGYRTSDGAVMNYTVRLIGKSGYHDMVKQAIDLTTSDKCPARPDFVPASDWEAGKFEQVNSWRTTLTGGHAGRQYDEQLTPGDGFYTSPDDDDIIVLLHMEKLAEEVVTPSPKAPANSRNKTLAKKHLTEHSALDKYLGRLNLAPGKVASVEVATLAV